MKTYIVNIHEVTKYKIEIEAENQKAAEELAVEMAEDGKLELSETDATAEFDKHDWTVTEKVS